MLANGPFSKMERPINSHFPYGKKQGSCQIRCPGAARGQQSGLPNFALQIRLPTTSIYGNSGQLSGQLSRQPTTPKYEKSGQLSGQRSGLPMGILPCKLGCPLLPYMETVGSSVGSLLLPNIKKWAAQWAVEWAAHGNFAM